MKPHKVYKNKKKQQFYCRGFLNEMESEHTGSAKSHLYVTKADSESNPNQAVWDIEGGLEIRDCSRRIDLAFDGDTDEHEYQIDNGILKLQTLINICTYQLGILEQVKSLGEGEKSRLEKNKK